MATKEVVYLIGQPGAGKTTLMAALIDKLKQQGATPRIREQPMRHLEFRHGVHLGWRGVFGGTDMLSMSIQPRVLGWLTSPQAPEIVLAEGDRLGNGKFFTAVKGFANLTVMELKTPNDLANQRRLARASQHNADPQTATWVQGRITKVTNLKDYVNVEIDGRGKPAELADVIFLAVPAVRRLAEA